jgi:hypothetical protein
VPYLRVLVSGLIQGAKSATYIILLLFIIIYIFAILGCNIFGANDPNHFGDTSVAMLSLFQVSTLGSWTSIAYISWFGCREYLYAGYDDANPSRIHTQAGVFEGFKCKDIETYMGSYFCFFICDLFFFFKFHCVSLFTSRSLSLSLSLLLSFSYFKQ